MLPRPPSTGGLWLFLHIDFLPGGHIRVASMVQAAKSPPGTNDGHFSSPAVARHGGLLTQPHRLNRELAYRANDEKVFSVVTTRFTTNCIAITYTWTWLITTSMPCVDRGKTPGDLNLTETRPFAAAGWEHSPDPCRQYKWLEYF